ncbi:hypothetical protein H2O64_22500 [Kordia sp. YSTF-M3]|uniref:Bacteriocin n=1 Tax=Kordia aestuariivivens TaxID=2759037 RepID=A0ABR7QG44_9FLAO|nr:hypothetical protein [Kordia aestuariivivens]MBC8757458.1 hypothetical protein [Kordia aestuariivivens]
MLKNILNVTGAEVLTKKSQKTISGGNGSIGEGFGGPCRDSHDCTATNTIPSICCSGICIYTTNWRDVC